MEGGGEGSGGWDPTGEGREVGGPGPPWRGGGEGQGAGLAPQDRHELGKQGPTSGSVATQEVLPVPLAPRTPSSDVPLPPAQRMAPLHREPPVIGQRGCMVAGGWRLRLVGSVQGLQAPGPL